MLTFPGSLRVFLAVEPCDMRKGFEGLHALLAEQLKENIRSGALFVCKRKPERLYAEGS
jgi:transposase